MIKISLDIENTLAATQALFLERYNATHDTEYTIYDIVSYDDIHEDIDREEFLSRVHSLWTFPMWIQPTESSLSKSVDILSEYGTVDIVTNRVGVEEKMGSWLSIMQIDAYRNLVSTGKSKADLDYDIYIDDRPHLASETKISELLYLIKRPYNQDVWDRAGVITVGSVREAVMDIMETYD